MTRPAFGRPVAADRRHAPRLPPPGQMALALWAPAEIAARRHLLVIEGGATGEPTAPVAATARRAA